MAGRLENLFIGTGYLVYVMDSSNLMSKIYRIVPIIAAALYFPVIFLAFQSVMMYLSMSYPKYTGSVLAGNHRMQ